jgi:hypothetical protein
MCRIAVACAFACVIPSGALLAQKPPDLQGNWVAKTDECGDLKLEIKLVEGPKPVGFAYGGPGLGTTPLAFWKR